MRCGEWCRKRHDVVCSVDNDSDDDNDNDDDGEEQLSPI